MDLLTILEHELDFVEGEVDSLSEKKIKKTLMIEITNV